jgi:hypothetical protein
MMIENDNIICDQIKQIEDKVNAYNLNHIEEIRSKIKSIESLRDQKKLTIHKYHNDENEYFSIKSAVLDLMDSKLIE